MSRVHTAVLLVLLFLLAWLVAPLWNRDARQAQTRVPASQAVTDAFMGTLCRPPNDQETLKWDSRPFDSREILPQLILSPEGSRVSEIRRVYIETLARDPMDGNCAALREWVDGSLDSEQVRRRISDSFEYRRVTDVRRAFTESLGRDPADWDNATLRRWVDSEFTPSEIRRRVAAQKPVVGVHYFTWYRGDEREWGNGVTAVQAGAPKPRLGWYTSSDPIVIDTQLEQMALAGFDLVIVQVDPETPDSWAVAHRVFERLPRHRLRAAVMIDGLYASAPTVKAMWANRARAEFARHPNYFFLHGWPLVMVYSTTSDFALPGVTLRNVYWTDSYAAGTNTFNVDRLLYPRDWPFWAPTPQPVVNGVVPVVPGYVDAHLGRQRSMEYPRNDGRMYHEQWQRALALRPELILVYSWNEHFEQTGIEPTDAWGDRYVEWTACYAAHARRGTRSAC